MVTLTKHRGDTKPDDEQLHVFPFSVLDACSSSGRGVDVLTSYPMSMRVRDEPYQPKPSIFNLIRSSCGDAGKHSAAKSGDVGVRRKKAARQNRAGESASRGVCSTKNNDTVEPKCMGCNSEKVSNSLQLGCPSLDAEKLCRSGVATTASGMIPVPGGSSVISADGLKPDSGGLEESVVNQSTSRQLSGPSLADPGFVCGHVVKDESWVKPECGDKATESLSLLPADDRQQTWRCVVGVSVGQSSSGGNVCGTTASYDNGRDVIESCSVSSRGDNGCSSPNGDKAMLTSERRFTKREEVACCSKTLRLDTDADRICGSDVFTDCAESFVDTDVGGVAVALTHGSVMFEVARHETHATTALETPNRSSPTRLALVFYQHRRMNRPGHGSRPADADQSSGLPPRSPSALETGRSLDRCRSESESVESGSEVIRTCPTPFVRANTLTTTTTITKWIKPQPAVFGPYQCWG